VRDRRSLYQDYVDEIGSCSVRNLGHSVPAYSTPNLPTGWRLVQSSSPVRADLNGDGLPDEAVLATDGHATKAFAFLAREGGHQVVELMESQELPEKCQLELLPPGRYQTACGKGLVECNGTPEEITPRSPVLSFSDQNVAVVFLFERYDSKKVWLSDRGPSRSLQARGFGISDAAWESV
jgi:hypothetical protein